MATNSIKELSYLLIELVNGGIPTDDSKINYKIARAHIRNAVGFYLRARFWEEKRNSDENYSSNISTKQVEVKYDEDSELYYVDTLGESIDGGGMSSFNISPLNPNSRWAIKYVPVTPQELFNQSLLKARIPNTVQYYKLGDKLFFTNADAGGTKNVILSQANVIPTDDNDSAIPEDIKTPVLERAYRVVMNLPNTQSDRDNDGVPVEPNHR